MAQILKKKSSNWKSKKRKKKHTIFQDLNVIIAFFYLSNVLLLNDLSKRKSKTHLLCLFGQSSISTVYNSNKPGKENDCNQSVCLKVEP